LFFGESEQRNDQDGLGNFGEGWKMFLLICARNGIRHKVETVGFSFYGQMSDTEHDVQVLEILVYPNNREVGTLVTVQCTEEDFTKGTMGFAIVRGIDKEHCGEMNLIPNEYGKLFVNGVLIENQETENPLSLRYAYHLKNREIINRDRSQVDTEKTYEIIKRIWSNQTDIEEIKEYVKLAYNGETSEDVQRGASYWNMPHEMRDVWTKNVADIHGCKVEQLVLSSRNIQIDNESVYRNYVIVQMPDKWEYMLSCLGIKNASEVVKMKFSDMEEIDVTDLSDYERQVFKRAKIDAKNALKLSSIKELPAIKVVDEIKDMNGVTDANGMYDKESRTIYMIRERLVSQRFASKTLIHECNHWYFGGNDNTSYFTDCWEEITVNLLGH
jgi:hypothetical protein